MKEESSVMLLRAKMDAREAQVCNGAGGLDRCTVYSRAEYTCPAFRLRLRLQT